MKKTSKRIVSALSLFVLLLSLAACGSKDFKCDLCNKEKHEKPHTTEIMGKEVEICEECYEDLKGLTGK